MIKVLIFDLGKVLDLQMNFAEFADVWNSTFDLEPIISEEFICPKVKKLKK